MIDERPGLRPKTIELNRCLLRRHLLLTFGPVLVVDIREAQVRRWRKERLDADVSTVTVAKAYRLLKALEGPVKIAVRCGEMRGELGIWGGAGAHC